MIRFILTKSPQISSLLSLICTLRESSTPYSLSLLGTSLLITTMSISSKLSNVSKIQRNNGFPKKGRKFLLGTRSLCPFTGNNATSDDAVLIDELSSRSGLRWVEILLFSLLGDLSVQVVTTPSPIELAKPKSTYFL